MYSHEVQLPRAAMETYRLPPYFLLVYAHTALNTLVLSELMSSQYKTSFYIVDYMKSFQVR